MGAPGDCPHVHTIHFGQLVILEPGDWAIAEPDGKHFYPCKPLILEDEMKKLLLLAMVLGLFLILNVPICET
jgi:hypothetical protein